MPRRAALKTELAGVDRLREHGAKLKRSCSATHMQPVESHGQAVVSSRSHKESNFHQEHNVFYYNVRGGGIFGVTCPLNTNPNLECMSKERH